MINPKVSVIVPSYNSAETIVECLSSLAAQTYDNIEVIFVDNHSSDNSKDLALHYLKKSSLKFKNFSEKQKGVSFARNRGLSEASGTFICFLDSDDWLFPDSIERRVMALSKEGVSCVYGPYLRVRNMVNDEGKIIRPPPRVDKKNQFTSNHIPNLCGMYDKTNVGLVFQKNIGHEDFQMWLEVLQRCEFALNVPGNALAKYRVSNNSASGNKFKAAIWHYRVLNMHEMSTCARIYYFIQYCINSILRRMQESVKCK